MPGTIQQKIWELILQYATPQEADWLTDKSVQGPMEVMTAFVSAPRFLSKKSIDSTYHLTDGDISLVVSGWSLVTLSRVWLLTLLKEQPKELYIKHIETLFDTAEMKELVALYSALPVLAYPEQWLFKATDAVRSNMGVVFEAIARYNTYPEKYFSELAWNQLVLKTIFNDKPIHFLIGLASKANPKLAYTLSDFAHERWAAGRFVAPQVWRLVSPFMNDTLLADMEHLFQSGISDNQKAAAIVCYEFGYAPALKLLSNYPELEKEVASGALAWTDIETTDLNTYVPQP